MAASVESNEFFLLGEPVQRVMTFVEARESITSKFAKYRQLLFKHESELMAKLDSFEVVNRDKLEPLEEDLKKLELTLEQVELNLSSNNLMEFQLKQASEIRNQIAHFMALKRSLGRVCLKWEPNECSFDKLGEVSIYRTRREERETITPLLKLEPREGDTLYVVNDTWFHKWKKAVNLDSSDLDNDDEIMENIPIDNFAVLGNELDSVNITTLHSEAWDQLLCWHGLADGSVPVSVTNDEPVTAETIDNTSSYEAKLKFTYRFIRQEKWSNINHMYFHPVHTFQDVYNAVTRNLTHEKQNIKMYSRYVHFSPQKVFQKFMHGTIPLLDSDLVTDFSAQIGGNTRLRFYFVTPN